MRYSFVKFILFGLFVMTMPSSCIMEANDVDIETYEQQILDDWMAKYVPEADRWDDGYYTLVTDEGYSSEPYIYQYSDCWVKYNLTGYDLSGEVICVTRTDSIAYQLGVFDPMLRYIPNYHDLYYDEDLYYDLDTYDYLPEFLNLAFQNEELKLRAGTKVTFYVRYDIIDEAATGLTGYAGQYTLSTYQPLKAVVEITEVIADPFAYELAEMKNFLDLNGGVLVNYRESDGEDIEDEEYAEYNEAQESLTNPDTGSYLWSNALDTVAHLYVYRHYTPDVSLTYPKPYKSNVAKNNNGSDNPYYSLSMAELDAAINEVINDEDYENVFYSSILSQDYIEFSGSAEIWYIGRFMDGFIFDTNISGVKELITGISEETYVLDYNANATELYVNAWYYALPQLRYGQWATIITSSQAGYGEVTLQDNIPAYTPLIFHIYVVRQE